MPEGLSVWVPFLLVLGLAGVFGFAAWRAGEFSVFMRSWIPSWRFFENTGNLPVLEFTRDGDSVADRWSPVPNPSGSGQARLLYSPASNSFHAFETLVLDFALNPSNEDLESSLVDEGVRRVLAFHPGTKTVRFKVSWVDQEGTCSDPVWEGVWNSPHS
jgi:hypothetical protein